MSNFHPDLVRLDGVERHSRLLAEAAQWRMLKALQTNSAQSQGNKPPWLRQRVVDAWCWLTQPFANRRRSGQSSSVAGHV